MQSKFLEYKLGVVPYNFALLNNLRFYVDSNQLVFDITVDRDFIKLYHAKRFIIMGFSFVTLKIVFNQELYTFRDGMFDGVLDKDRKLWALTSRKPQSISVVLYKDEDPVKKLVDSIKDWK